MIRAYIGRLNRRWRTRRVPKEAVARVHCIGTEVSGALDMPKLNDWVLKSGSPMCWNASLRGM